MEWKNWFNVLFTERNRLPTYSGIYAIVDVNNRVWYVGQAINLRNRWTGKTHHRYPQLIRSNRKLCHRIYYQPVPIDSLDQQEKHYINLFQPELNGCKVKSYLPKQPKLESEIKRLLKVLNKSTMLFPLIRSLVAGEYEDESGTMCLLIIIYSNDYQIISNSINKRYAPEVRKAWIENKNYCGRNEEKYNHKYISTYYFNGYKIEFLEGWEILNFLETPSNYDRYVGVADIFGVQVKTLKNLSVVDELNLEEEWSFTDSSGKISLRDNAYLKYRQHLLKPITTLIHDPTNENKVYQPEIFNNIPTENKSTLLNSKSETTQLSPIISQLQVGDRLMFMLKEPFTTHYIGFRWTDIDCAKATVKQIKNTEIQFKLDSGFSVTLSLKELEEITIHPLKE
ncbi:hypothetical protein NIES2100_23100 [Calothrix sp. NIES-2100]|uniref:GIY-YIG nuclease family protein n=1 Tax=Calothrix sp. NIES-2100 TaxID=1954172 RepID=UPI000B5E1186|nr:hypothetical protein NIES2100_23100 [Calothrix sp. NIES-2100]